MKYTAINIGPIVSTFNMVRKPRDIWAASYMFSHLMKCIVDEIKKEEKRNREKPTIKVFSPNFGEIDTNKIGIGLYPDRVYCIGEWDFSAKRSLILNLILNKFASDLGMNHDKNFKDYFNIMCATVEVEADNDGNSETKAIRELNHLLDCMELNERAMSGKSLDAIWNFITNDGKREELYCKAFIDGKFGKVSYPNVDGLSVKEYGTLAEYASLQLSTVNPEKWDEARKIAKDIEGIKENKRNKFTEIEEDAFYRKLKESFPDEIKSYHKYICIVQADGDNMGKTFSHKALKDDETAEISEKLVAFGKNASELIYKYGGLPIYAGGDDLLFLAPVVGKTKKRYRFYKLRGSKDNPAVASVEAMKNKKYNKTIIDLLKDIDKCFRPVKKDVVLKHLKNDNGKIIVPSMSYGVSITYYKFPLYEALASARHLLFDVAKGVAGKNVIAWCLQKNAGSCFEGAFSKNDLLNEFQNVILNSKVTPPVVAAVSHKIRENQKLLELWINDSEHYKQRNLNFFKKYMEFNEKDPYKQSVLDLLDKFYSVYPKLFEGKDKSIDGEVVKILQTDKAKGITTQEQKRNYLKQNLRDDMFKMLYSMLRTAKFINGEEVKDE